MPFDNVTGKGHEAGLPRTDFSEKKRMADIPARCPRLAKTIPDVPGQGGSVMLLCKRSRRFGLPTSIMGFPRKSRHVYAEYGNNGQHFFTECERTVAEPAHQRPQSVRLFIRISQFDDMTITHNAPVTETVPACRLFSRKVMSVIHLEGDRRIFSESRCFSALAWGVDVKCQASILPVVSEIHGDNIEPFIIGCRDPDDLTGIDDPAQFATVSDRTVHFSHFHKILRINPCQDILTSSISGKYFITI